MQSTTREFSQPVNFCFIEQLCIEYLHHEAYITERAEQASQFKLLSEIRSEMLSGNVISTIDKIHAIDPNLLSSNTTLAFRLYKQQFVELLRDSKAPFPEALNFLRSELVAFSNPETFAEFKKTLVGLVLKPDMCTELELSKRDELANAVHAILLKHLGIREPKLALTIRYLSLIHNMHHIMMGKDASVPEVATLLLPDRDEEEDVMIENQEDGQAKPVMINSTDVNVLAQVTGTSPLRARRALTIHNGDLDAAFLSELSKVRLARSQLTELVKEYCIFRGILNSTDTDIIGRLWDPHSGEPNAEDENKSRVLLALWRIRELINSYSVTSSHSAPPNLITTKILAELESLGFLLPYERLCVPEAFMDCSDSSFEKETPVSPCLYFALKQLQFLELVRAGQWEDAINQVRSEMAPLTIHLPYLLRPLKDTILLLAYRTAELPPKDLARTFLRGLEFDGTNRVVEFTDDGGTTGMDVVIDAIWKRFNPSTLAGPLYATLGRYVGLPEPALVRIISGLLDVHSEWLNYRQEDDRFENLLSIDTLKLLDPYTQSFTNIFGKSKSDDAQGDSVMANSEQNDTGGLSAEEIALAEEDALELDLSEEDIMNIMEMMNCTRHEAITMLVNNGGDIAEVMSILFPE